MKKSKIIMLTLFAMLVSACSSDEPVDVQKQSQKQGSVASRSIEDAVNIANQYGQQSSVVSRGKAKNANVNKVDVITSCTSRSLSDTLMYVVNFEDDNGFMVVSAKKSSEPILAIIDEGQYNADDVEKVDGFNYFMESAKEYVVQKESVNGVKDSVIFRPTLPLLYAYYSDTIVNVVQTENRVKVNFGQDWPENKYCPNKKAGCVPVAIAQLCTYLKPEMKNMSITFPNSPVNTLSIDWNEVSKHTKSTMYANPNEMLLWYHYDSCEASEEDHDKLALFIRQVGTIGKASYSYNPEMTKIQFRYVFTLTENILPQFEHVYPDHTLYGRLKFDGVAIVEGFSNADNVGHAWIIDGVCGIETYINHYRGYNPLTGEYQSVETESEILHYAHCNWGWAGLCNGYCLMNIYDTSKVYSNPISSRTDYSPAFEACIYYKN